MPKSHARSSRPKTRWSLIFILLLACALSYFGYKYFFAPKQAADIFMIAPVSIEFGQTTLSGKLTKDTPLGTKGNYLLVLSDSRPVLLDVQGLDSLVGKTVSISGILSPAVKPGDPIIMTVSEIKTK